MNSCVILIPIWGDTHIKMCANSVLPALLAHGNLPYMSTYQKITLRFLTTKPSSRTLQENQVCKRLAEFADISFCYIDDLVNLGDYGLTLTMAYERGIRTDPEELQVKQCYVFLNGDLVPSNNTLTTVQRRIEDGYNAMLSPGVRVVEQDITPILDELRSKGNGIIDSSGRELVRLTIDHLHPTVIAAKINNKEIGTSISHQYFAQVDNDLLIARFFLLFMLCIKPERPLPMVTSHCDYSFIPEMCPSGNYTVITDSDDAFLMELAPIEQESSYIYLGKKNLNGVTRRMQNWVTKEHFDYSKYVLYFHATDLSINNTIANPLATTEAQLSEVLEQIYSELNKYPRVSHEYHPFWNNLINLCKFQEKLLDRPSAYIKNGLSNKFLNMCFKHLLGAAPFVTKLHYKYRDYSSCISTLQATLDDKVTNVLYVCGDRKDMFKPFFNKSNSFFTTIIRSDDMNNISDIKDYDVIFVECNTQGFKKFTRYMLSQKLTSSVKVVVYIDLVTPNLPQDSITPYLCLLNNKVTINRMPTINAQQKQQYYKSSTTFVNEMYGRRNFLKMISSLILFAYNAISIAISNICKTNQNKDKINNPEKLSSLILNFNW